jgi:predicted aconitase
VLGARTDRYGDFLDIGAAITGRVPDAGLHRDADRRATIRLDCAGLSRRLLGEDAAWGVLGHLAGRLAGSGVPVLTGVPVTVTEDQLKAFGAAAASSGGVGLFHVVGVTPEAPELAAIAAPDVVTHVVDADQVRAVRDELTTAHGPDLDALCLGTPHFSLTEFERLAGLLTDGGPFHHDVSAYVTTSRAVLAEADRLGYAETVRSAGARIVVDTCTYITPILDAGLRTAMTNSGKWAWYAPGNIGVDVALGSLAECVASARAGRIVRDEALWAS